MENLKIAIQKSGRLSDESLGLLKACGIRFSNGAGKLRTEALNFPLEVYFLRDDDIPQYVADGVADLGMVGENVLYEKQLPLTVAARLGFGRCRLALAVPKNEAYRSIESLRGKRIATSYPGLLQKFLQSQQVEAEIHEISGSVEIAPGIGLADAICDLVSTGSTLLTNGLREVETVLQSEAVLARPQQLSVEKEALLQRLLFRIEAVQQASRNKYILLNAPNDRLSTIIALLPGIKSPTVLPLALPGWSSLHSVIEENQFWEVIEQLKLAGAEGILVVPIEKMIA
jgi:ATP phosphoribosyltransferase